MKKILVVGSLNMDMVLSVEYILSCVLEKQIVNTDGIKELLPELKRIGNNLNQIAKRCNEGDVAE